MNEDAKKRIERMKLQMLARAKAFWEEDGKAKKKELKLGPDEDPLLAVKIEPKRSYIAFGCITAFLCVLVGRAFYLQCGIGTKFLQHQGEIRFARTLTVPAVRGRILDRNGIVLASTMPETRPPQRTRILSQSSSSTSRSSPTKMTATPFCFCSVIKL